MYPTIDYDYEKMQLNRIYEHPDLKNYTELGLQTDQVRKVYGELKFPPLPKNRAYTMACFVSSIDGKIAYLDNPAGPIIAQSNALDPDGAMADFWSLCLFRASADAVFCGVKTMHAEPNSLICVFDKYLEQERIRLGKSAAPWSIICSLDGSDIPFEDTMLQNQPCMINTTFDGLPHIEKGLKQDYYIVCSYENLDDIDEHTIKTEFKKNQGKIPVIVTGKGRNTNTDIILRVLKILGIDKVMVESPSYCHSMLLDELLDEMVLNLSCIYIGGDTVSFGKGMQAATSLKHPHSEILSIHSHSPSFFYFRHRFIYGKTPKL